MFGKKAGKKLEKYVESYVVFDLEATGVDTTSDMIIEIGAIKVKNRKIAGEYNTFVNPQIDIPQRVTVLTGITNEDVLTGKVIDEAIVEFNDFCEDLPLVGHNINRFDMKMLFRFATKCTGLTIANDYIDTLPFSRHLLPNLQYHRLAYLCEYYNIDSSGHHRALNDAVMNQKLFERLSMEPPSGRESKICPICGELLRKRSKRHGLFYSCSTYPECKYILKDT